MTMLYSNAASAKHRLNEVRQHRKEQAFNIALDGIQKSIGDGSPYTSVSFCELTEDTIPYVIERFRELGFTIKKVDKRTLRHTNEVLAILWSDDKKDISDFNDEFEFEDDIIEVDYD